jgi:hypothetical protein
MTVSKHTSHIHGWYIEYIIDHAQCYNPWYCESQVYPRCKTPEGLYGSTWMRFGDDGDKSSESTSCCKLYLNWQQGSRLKSQRSPISLRPELRLPVVVCLSRWRVMIEMRGEEDFGRQRTPFREWFRILDWFEKATKSGLGLQGTQWPALYTYGTVLSIVQEENGSLYH